MAAALMFSMASFKPKGDKKNLYDFKAKTIDGKDFDFSKLKGKKVMIVNTASMCGFTPQYADLEKLYQQYGGEHFTIIGFPANNFGSQEPGSNTEIHEFCTKNYSVTFQMMEKISVKGDDMHPLYQWLTEKSENGVQDSPVQWNFQKFLIDENGNWAGVALSKELPNSDRIVNWIKGKN
ncbi:MAG TPA: glutathione peroxidase [Bacteroidia bacterium]|nr:glutathione peroxidase [Bacteroidia bacterium]